MEKHGCLGSPTGGAAGSIHLMVVSMTQKETMTHRGYTGTVEKDGDDYFGHVVGIRDSLLYGGNNPQELEDNFIECIDSYLEDCTDRGRSPNVPGEEK